MEAQLIVLGHARHACVCKHTPKLMIGHVTGNGLQDYLKAAGTTATRRTISDGLHHDHLHFYPPGKTPLCKNINELIKNAETHA